MSESRSAGIVHFFIGASYLFTFFGGLASDAILGRYRTILYMSCVYLIGTILTTYSALNSSQKALGVGLLHIAIGTGGIKPCVSTFGGDQFKDANEHYVKMFFDVFYFTINAGSLISIFVSPIVAEMKCFGRESCYPVAFGVPVVLLAISIILFWIGRDLYVTKPPDSALYRAIFMRIKVLGSQKFKIVKSDFLHSIKNKIGHRDCELFSSECSRISDESHRYICLNSYQIANGIENNKNCLKRSNSLFDESQMEVSYFESYQEPRHPPSLLRSYSDLVPTVSAKENFDFEGVKHSFEPEKISNFFYEQSFLIDEDKLKFKDGETSFVSNLTANNNTADESFHKTDCVHRFYEGCNQDQSRIASRDISRYQSVGKNFSSDTIQCENSYEISESVDGRKSTKQSEIHSNSRVMYLNRNIDSQYAAYEISTLNTVENHQNVPHSVQTQPKLFKNDGEYSNVNKLANLNHCVVENGRYLQNTTNKDDNKDMLDTTLSNEAYKSADIIGYQNHYKLEDTDPFASYCTRNKYRMQKTDSNEQNENKSEELHSQYRQKEAGTYLLYTKNEYGITKSPIICKIEDGRVHSKNTGCADSQVSLKKSSISKSTYGSRNDLSRIAREMYYNESGLQNDSFDVSDIHHSEIQNFCKNDASLNFSKIVIPNTERGNTKLRGNIGSSSNTHSNERDFSDEIIDSEIQKAIHVLKAFLYIPFFWMLYDQQSTTWIEQGTKMREIVRILGFQITLRPEQMQALNGVLILVFIPLFSKFLYPFLQNKGVNLSSLNKMCCGMVLASFSFFAAAILEIFMRRGVNILWQTPQYVLLTAGEIMLSLTGIEFVYNESPERLKGLLLSGWLMTVAAGNLYVVVFTSLNVLRWLSLGDPEIGNYLLYGCIGLTAAYYLHKQSLNKTNKIG